MITPIPRLSGWQQFEGGTCGAGRRSYECRLDDGQPEHFGSYTRYYIAPLTDPAGRFLGYLVSVWDPKVHMGHQQLGTVHRPQAGVTAARQHYVRRAAKLAAAGQPGAARRRTITRTELARRAAVNSKRLPRVVEVDGSRKQWVGIGWVDEGQPHGDEVLVVEG